MGTTADQAARQRLEIRPFTSDDLPAAGRLLARRHAQQRIVVPFLSPRYEDPATAESEVRKVWETEGASGAVAIASGEVTGYLLGAPKPSKHWGPNVWIESAGQAADRAEDIRDLYAMAATRWVDEGHTAHYALTPVYDRDLLEAWYRLGFGQQHMHGLRPTPDTRPDDPPRVTVRRADRDDIPALAALDLALPQHQGLAPTFSAGGELPSLEAAIAEWEEDFGDPSFAIFVAEHGGAVVGSAIGCSIEKSSSHVGPDRPDSAGFLGFAAVFPEQRGLGAGRALGEAVMWWSAEAGFACVVTDWRVTNLLSSRAWPALGFHDTFVRLHRLIGY